MPSVCKCSLRRLLHAASLDDDDEFEEVDEDLVDDEEYESSEVADSDSGDVTSALEVPGATEGAEGTVEDGTEEPVDKAELKFLKPPKGVESDAFFCTEIQVTGLPTGYGCPTKQDMAATLNVQEGFWIPKEKVKEDLEYLKSTGLFKDVSIKVQLSLVAYFWLFFVDDASFWDVPSRQSR
jgi:hypothetical protein